MCRVSKVIERRTSTCSSFYNLKLLVKKDNVLSRCIVIYPTEQENDRHKILPQVDPVTST